MNYILLLLSIVLVNNVITSQFLGICPFLGVSKKVDTAAGMGAAGYIRFSPSFFNNIFYSNDIS